MRVDITVRRFAIKYEPPTLAIEYEKENKIFLKKIRIKSRSVNVTASHLVDKLIEQNKEALNLQRIHRTQLEGLVSMLLAKTPPSPVNKGISKRDISKPVDKWGDLNKASDEEVDRAKSEMDVAFEANRKKLGDDGYEWDKRADFETPSEECDWDEESD